MNNAAHISNPSPSKAVGGFTTVELLAALSLFGIVAAGLVMNSIAVARYNRVSNAFSAATDLAQDKLEQLRGLSPAAPDPSDNKAPPMDIRGGNHVDLNNPLTALGGTTGAPRIFTRKWSVTSDSPIAGISTVTVTVSWTGGSTRSVNLSTYVCQTPGCI